MNVNHPIRMFHKRNALTGVILFVDEFNVFLETIFYFSDRYMKRYGTLCLWPATILLRIFFPAIVHSQFYNTGEDPGYLKWEQIRSGHFRIIFPREIEPEAQRFARILEWNYEPGSAQLGHRPRPIPVILHNHSVISNGFVAWAPKRMEVVTTPSAYGFAQDYLEHLALHEFRHVVQVDKLDQGVTGALKWPLGEIGTSVVAGLMPFWFLEGDAVDAETRLSLSGRGRLPSWEMELKALLAENRPLYTYEKAFMGSYRDYVPSHYKYGYQMVTHGREKYGNALWDSTVSYTARHPYTLYPFYFGLKKYAGLSKSGLYSESMAALKNSWREQSAGRIYTPSVLLNHSVKKHYTSYRFPRYLEDGSVFAEKSGIDQIDEFVRIDGNGNEKRIYRPGFHDAANISVEGDVIAWTEIIPDIRWSRRSYSVIKLYHMDTGTEKTVRWRTRYFAPDLTKDAGRITAVEADEQNRYFLLVIDAVTGEVLRRIPSPGNEYIQYPVWNPDQTGIYLTSLGKKGKKILYNDLASGTWREIFDAGYEDVAELDAGRDYLVFRGTFSGIDNIYAIHLETGKCWQVTSSVFGAFMPQLSANEDKMIYSDYSSQGYNIHEMDFLPENFIPLRRPQNQDMQSGPPGDEEGSKIQYTDDGTGRSFETEPYRKYAHLLHFHSWLPLYTDIENPDFRDPVIYPGFMLFSQNRLSTATAILGYRYSNHDHYLHASYTYTGWYPALRFSYDFGGSPFVDHSEDGVDPPAQVKKNLNLKLKVYFPLNMTLNRYVTGMQPSVESTFSRAYFYYTRQGAYKSGITFMDYRLYYYTYLKKSVKDVLPRLGLVLDARYIDAPFESEQIGSQVYGSATVYLPGILRHQTLKVRAASQKQEAGGYLMGNLADMPRGIEQQTAVQLRTLAMDYVFPVAYPDLSIWHALYVKRIRGDVFFDHAFGQEVYPHADNNGPVNRHFTSLGAELTADMHPAHLIFPLNLGVRLVYLPETGTARTELIIDLDLNQF